MAKIFLETSDNAYTVNNDNGTYYGLAGDQVVTVKAKGITVDAAVERLVFAGQMSEYTFVQSGPNALKVMKGADTITTAFVQADANGTQLTFANGTVDAKLGATAITLGGKTLGATAAPVTPVTIDTTLKSPADVVTPPPASSGLILTVGQDVKDGSAVSDTFTANVAQNALGGQVNTLGSGDMIDGNGGVDTLKAKITVGAFAGSGLNVGVLSMPIQPETTSVEIVKLEAVNASLTNMFGLAVPNEVYVNAKDMTGVNFIGSDHSDANLTIQNLTTLTDDGAIRPVSDITVGMSYSGNADSSWNESDLHVYFDQDYLNPEVETSTPGITMQVMNEDAYDLVITAGGTQAAATARALANVYMNLLEFKLNGVAFNLATGVSSDGKPNVAGIQVFEPKTGDGNQIITYDQLVTQMNIALDAFKASRPENLALQTVEVLKGAQFDTGPFDLDPHGNTRIGYDINITVDYQTGSTANTLVQFPSDLQITQADAVIDGETANHRLERTDQIGTTSTQNLLIKVALEKAGNAGDGGELIIGSMYKDGENVYSDQYAGKGIEEFDVTVYGGSDKPSSLSQLASTGNNLETVKVVTNSTQTGSFASLTIGNSETDNALAKGDAPSDANLDALKDVQTFDATGFKGDLTLFAGLSREVTAKYLDVQDIAANAAADNVNFAYNGGTGNDYINLYMDAANLAQPGTSSREDLTLTVNGNAGNDEIVTKIDTDSANTNWYANQQINANLAIGKGKTVATGQLQLNGNDGNDTIRNIGSGDYAINGGAGNDTIYSDNSGLTMSATASSFNEGRATWVLNTATGSTNVDNLLSQNDVPAQTNIVNLTLNVSFKGFEGKAVVGGAVAGGVTGVSVTDLTINQAIKEAINKDAELSKLLVVEDGPANTLIVRSLIDGAMTALNEDLNITLSSTALTSGQTPITALHLITDAQAAQLGFGPATTGLVNSFSPTPGRYDTKVAFGGGDSAATSNSIIVGGTENDVIVLSTGAGSKEGVGYAGLNNGTDTIVNFVDGTAVTTSVWSGGTNEIVPITFTLSDGVPFAETLIFDGVTVNLSAPTLQGVIPALDVATQFMNQYNAAAATNHWVATKGINAGDVILTNDAPGNVTDLLAANFTGTYIDLIPANGSVTIGAITQGTNAPGLAATSSSFTVTYTTATTALAAAINLTGINTVAEVQGDGALTLANKVAAEVTFVGFTAGPVVAAAGGSSYSVTFTAAPGAVAIPAGATAAAFGVDGASTLDGVNGSFASFLGAAATTVPPVLITTTTYSAGLDYLDFTSYGVKAVYVGGTVVAGNFTGGTLVTGFAATAGQSFINLVEGTGAAVGAYTMTEYTEAGATDTVVGIIGVADFGATQTFITDNFHI